MKFLITALLAFAASSAKAAPLIQSSDISPFTLSAGSSLTIATSFTSAITTVTITNPPIVKGQWVEMASSAPAANIGQFTWAGLVSTETFAAGIRYRECYQFFIGNSPTSQAQPYLMFNGDWTTKYSCSIEGFQNAVGFTSNAINRGSATAPLAIAPGANTDNFSFLKGCFEFYPTPYGIAVDILPSSGWVGTGSSNGFTNYGGVEYKNDASISSVSLFLRGGGTMNTARFTIERKISQ